MKKVAKVVVWQNGMVMVFDTEGQQVPELQGLWTEMEAAIRARFDGEIETGVWRLDP